VTSETDLFTTHTDQLVHQATTLFKALDTFPLEERVTILNRIRIALHEHSPFREEPVDCVMWVKNDRVEGNEYNPNKVAPPEMRLLEISIHEDGYTQPIVAHPVEEGYEVVDGFHRKRIGKECPKIRERVQGYLPITLLRKERENTKDRMAATIRHNRARGVHGVMPMIDVVATLLRQGWTDEEVARELGMDAEEVLRFKQNSGLPELFGDSEYSKAWE